MIWLTPVNCETGVWRLGKERKSYSEDFLEKVIKRMRVIHPRLLPFVKGNTLPDDPDEAGDTCGGAEAFALSLEGDIVFDRKKNRRGADAD
nr:hypothetical protein [Aneurinibacillus terranovensis]